MAGGVAETAAWRGRGSEGCGEENSLTCGPYYLIHCAGAVWPFSKTNDKIEGSNSESC